MSQNVSEMVVANLRLARIQGVPAAGVGAHRALLLPVQVPRGAGAPARLSRGSLSPVLSQALLHAKVDTGQYTQPLQASIALCILLLDTLACGLWSRCEDRT